MLYNGQPFSKYVYIRMQYLGYGYVVVFDLGVVMWLFRWFVVNGGVVGGG